VVEDPQEPALNGDQPRLFHCGELADVFHVPAWIEEQVARIVGIQVHGSDEQLVAPDAEIHDVGALVSQEAEDAARRVLSSDVRQLVEIEEVSAVSHPSLLPGEDVGPLEGGNGHPGAAPELHDPSQSVPGWPILEGA
jgi:hypothetical protein